jgi:lysophospholipase L1-like esterase
MRRFCFCLLFLVGASTIQAEEPFFFKKNDRIVFLGDSITEQYQYSSYMEVYLTTRFPDWNLTFLNAGISGDTATGGAGRFKSHILDENPTAVTINFGMNDGGYGKFEKPRNDQYVKNTTAMLEQAKKANVRVALVSPNAVDPRIQERFKLYLETQKEFYAPLKEIAEKNNAFFVDQYAVTRTVLERLDKEGKKDVKPFGDGFHTSSPGGLLMAHTIMVGLKAPALVSDVKIDVTKSESKTERCKVTALSATPKEISFERSDEALPIPVQKDWVSLLPYLNDLKDFNYYGLTVTGLTGEKYKLTIDGKEIATFSGKELGAGVNLGNLMVGPIYEQSQKAFNAINAKNQFVHQRFRSVLMANVQIPDWATDIRTLFAERKTKELQTRREKIDSLQAEIYKMVQPTTHTFKIVAAE